jgi:broad specificity phosphatase PhoE
MAIRHTEVFMVRHGQTDSNIAGLFHGATDVPLNETGLRQAELVAERVALLEDLQSLHTSPLRRAFATAEAISRRVGLSLQIHPDLQEMNFGEVEGLVLATMSERWPDLAERLKNDQDMDARFPGGESRGEFNQRVRHALDEIVTEYSGQRLVIVAHGGVISSLVAQILGDNPNNWRKYPVANCSVTHIEFATRGPVARLLNDVVHLEEVQIPVATEGSTE